MVCCCCATCARSCWAMSVSRVEPISGQSDVSLVFPDTMIAARVERTKLQADLGDLLIAGIKSPRQHQFIVETRECFRHERVPLMMVNEPGSRMRELSIVGPLFARSLPIR